MSGTDSLNLQGRRAGRGQHQGLQLPTSPSWMKDALCATVGGDLFYTEADEETTVREARQICARCDVAEQCLAYAVTHDEAWGVWGGLSAHDRRAVRRGHVSVAEAVKQSRERVFRAEQRARERDKSRDCAECGEVVNGRPGSRFCSDDCREQAQKPARETACSACGTGFLTRDYRARYCSDECRCGAERGHRAEYQRQYRRRKQSGEVA